MKTALIMYNELEEEFLLGSPNEGINKEVKTGFDLILYAMKKYAEQALDAASESIHQFETGEKRKVMCNSILNIKKQLK